MHWLAELALWLGAASIFLFILLMVFLSTFLTKLYDSIQPEVPEQEPKKQDSEPNPLFRYFPHLKSKLAWIELGEYPTPLHKAKVQKDGKELNFWIKREDLCSPIYGGNKVRTLQYQLAACQIHHKKNPTAQFHVLGSGGSNQVIASLVHGAPLNLNFHVRYVMGDEPDLDNTLNVLSTLSFKPMSLMLWDKPFAQLARLLSALYLTNGKDKVFGPGGNSIGGVLGQIGAALELAEQIASDEMPDVDAIYLPMGSSCTTSGLIMGVCLARYLRLNAFKSPKFKIVSSMVDNKVAVVHRKTGLMKREISKYFPFCPLFGIHVVSDYIKETLGVDLKSKAVDFFWNKWELISDDDVVGIYGGHSVKSRAAASLDTEIKVEGPCPKWASSSSLWLCGHFSAKAFAVLIERLEYLQDGSNVLLWQTKSQTQPLGKENEWSAFCDLAARFQCLKKWADDGKAASLLRPGKVDTTNGKPEDYRNVMTRVYK